MPHDLTPRSDSETSGSPPDHSETSSGVHSNSSRESHGAGNYTCISIILKRNKRVLKKRKKKESKF